MLIGSSNCRMRRELGDALRFRRAAAGKNLGETERAGMPAVAEQHHRTQRRQPRRFEFSGRGMAELGRQLAQHADIVRGLEALGENQRLAADFVERVFQLGDAIGRIDVDQDQAGLGGGELGQHPFAVVGRPDADAVAGLEPERQQVRRRACRPRCAIRRRSAAPSGAARPAPAGPHVCRRPRRRTGRWSRRSAALRWRRGRSFA